MAAQIPTNPALDIDNDEQAAVLYSPFRGKNVNPTSWTSKMNFWQRCLEQTAKDGRLITVDVNTLPQLFMRKGLTPKCLPAVVEELERLGKVKSLEEYKKRNSWISWGFSTLVKEPLSWGVSQVFGSPKKTPTVFVWPEVLQKVSEEVLCHLQSCIRQGIINHVLSHSKFEDLCSHIVNTKEHFDLVTNYLQMEKKIHLEQADQHGLLVKVCEENKASVSPIKVTDRHIFEINEARLKVENEIGTLSKEEDILGMEARGYVKNNNKRMALQCLRKKKRLDKVISLKSSTLFNLEEILSKIEEAETNVIIVQACEKGLAELKKINKENNRDKVESVMDEVHEAIQDAEDVNIATQCLSPVSDEEVTLLEEELAALLSESQGPGDSKELSSSNDVVLPDMACLSLADLDLPEVPTHSPSSSNAVSPSKEESSNKGSTFILPS